MKFLNKKGKISTKLLNAAVLAIVLLIVLFEIYATLIPIAQESGNSMNDSNQCASRGCVYNDTDDICYILGNKTGGSCAATSSIPLSGLFAGTGVIFVIIMAALLILVVKSYMPKGK